MLKMHIAGPAEESNMSSVLWKEPQLLAHETTIASIVDKTLGIWLGCKKFSWNIRGQFMAGKGSEWKMCWRETKIGFERLNMIDEVVRRNPIAALGKIFCALHLVYESSEVLA